MSGIFVVDTDSLGRPTRYSCEQLMENNEAYSLSVDYYYDIMHDASRDTNEVVAEGKEALLNSVAKHFGLIDGARCSIPPVTALWLIEVDSGAPDERQDLFSSCLELQPDSTQTCSVYKGSMSAYYLGAGEPLSFQNFIQQNLNRIGANSDYEISYLGATLDTSVLGGYDTAKDNLSPALNKAEAPEIQEQGRRTFTYVGGLMVAGFVAAFLGLFFVLYRRRQNFLAAQELEIALSKSDLDGMNGRDNNDSGILRPEQLEPEICEDGDIEVEQHDDEFSASNYRFDLATSMKNELFNIHGRATDPPKSYGPSSGLGIEETSDSDADSWAQTDGTIGSLELQLEPITAEV